MPMRNGRMPRAASGGRSVRCSDSPTEPASRTGTRTACRARCPACCRRMHGAAAYSARGPSGRRSGRPAAPPGSPPSSFKRHGRGTADSRRSFGLAPPPAEACAAGQPGSISISRRRLSTALAHRAVGRHLADQLELEGPARIRSGRHVWSTTCCSWPRITRPSPAGWPGMTSSFTPWRCCCVASTLMVA